MPDPLLDDDPVLRGVTSASNTREIFGNLDAEKGKSASVARPGTLFYDTTLPATSSNVGDDCPSGSTLSMFGYAGEGQFDSPRFVQDSPSSSRGHSHSDPLSHSRPLTTRHMHNSPPYNPAFHNLHNSGYSTGFSPSSFPHISSPSPCNQRIDDFGHITQQRDVEHLSPFVYPHPYRPLGLPDTDTTTHNAHANYQTGVQSSQNFNFAGRSPEVSSAAHRPFVNVGSYAHGRSASQRPSPPQIPGGYASAGPLHPVTYSPPNSAPPFGYPPLQGYSPSPPMYPPYSASPYNQPMSHETNRQRAWWYNPHHAAVPIQQPFDGAAGYQRNYPASYSMPPQIHPIHPSTPLPPMSPPTSPQLPGPSSHERRLGAGSTPVSGNRTGKKQSVRRSYHPNPPSYRSDWVMWTGNIPSNAVHDELWRFFTSFPEGTPDAPAKSGVLSIFLISRSNCAFINYESEFHLNAAIEHFNGRPLRPGDPRCPNLVCRIRKTDDDLKAGVGGQRGLGMHIRWAKQRKGKDVLQTEVSSVANEASSPSLPDKSSLSISSDDDSGVHNRPQSLTSSSSYASTNSSLLTRFFPQRYFILKSLTHVISIFHLSKNTV
ncbi:hypothetical protein C0993_005020 [Termitomyces sp. T159_Od127]|nr:hypothetical protein C0993_005020 [Termitomyces sp. T159_Od127]